MDHEGSIRGGGDDATVALPSRDDIGRAFDIEHALARAIEGVSKDDLWAEVSPLPLEVKHHILRVLNLGRGSKFSRPLAGPVLEVLQRGGQRADRMLHAMTTHGFPVAQFLPVTSLAILRCCSGEQFALTPRERELITVLLGYDRDRFHHRLALVCALRSTQPASALLALALLGADDSTARKAYETLAEGRRDLPTAPVTLSAIEAFVTSLDSCSDDATPATVTTQSVEAPGRPQPLAGGDPALAQLEGLIADAPEVADLLRVVASDIADLKVDPAMSVAIARAVEWIHDATTFLPHGGSVSDAAAALKLDLQANREAAARQDAEVTGLIELLEAVQLFEESGKPHLAEGLLRGSGFDRMSDLETRISALGDSPAGPDLGSSGVGRELPADAPVASAIGVEAEAPAARFSEEEAQEPQIEEATAWSSVANRRSDSSELSAETLEVSDVPIDAGAKAPNEKAPADEPETRALMAPEAQDQAVIPQGKPGVAVAQLTAVETESSPTEAVPLLAAHIAQDVCADSSRSMAGQGVNTWNDGTIASLVVEGRDALATLVAESVSGQSGKTAALRLFTGAFQCSNATLLNGDLVTLDLTEEERESLDADGARVFLAAAAGVAMTFGFSPFGPLDDLVGRARLSEHPAEQVMIEVAKLSKTEYRHRQLADDAFASPDDWVAIADRAEELRRQLGSPNVVNYQRAARILRHLVLDENSIGRGLLAVVSGARAAAEESGGRPQDWAEVRELRDVLSDPSRSQRIVTDADRAVHTPQQYREPIKHAAERRMRDIFVDVVATLDDALRLVARSSIPPRGAGHGSASRLLGALHAYERSSIDMVGDAALDRVVRWLANPPKTLGADVPVRELVENEMAPLYEIPRDLDGRPVHGPTLEEIDTLIAGRNPTEVVVGYLCLGNEAAASKFRSRTRLVLDAAAEEVVAKARIDLQTRRRQALDDTDRIIARLRSLNDDDKARQLMSQLDQYRPESGDGRYDLAIQGIETVTSEAKSRLSAIRSDLRARVDTIRDIEVRRRIADLLASDNEPLALEFITRFETDRPLPEIAPLGGDDFAEFYPRVVELAESASAPGTDTVRVVRKALGVQGDPATPVLERGLRAWESLAAQKRGRGTSMTIESLTHVLRMIGLVPKPHTQPREITKRKNAGIATWDVVAQPIDRSYVPEFGTQANGRYYVTVIWDSPSAKRVLESLDTAWSTRANIVLYFGTLPVEQRRQLRRACANRRLSPLVIDDSVVAWLTTRPEQGWRITQRVTLPFTAVNPFTPFARGEVPDEMFVGREHEQADVTDPTGPMFVYGGRQLGKSALLRKVERRWRAERERQGEGGSDSAPLAIYLDLNAEGVAGVPDNLWPVLGRRLVDDGIAKSPAKWTVDTVLRAISGWLAGDAGRQLLLLLDESDAFLTSDSGSSPYTGEPFPALQRLKGLMQESGGRFKTVFAGLHQVQRFYEMSNHPTGHGGREILVGPLQPSDAAELLRNPLHALGYEFQSDETMWRLLMLTNYQASLIQIMGEALVRHMLERFRAPTGGVRVVVTDRDVDDVYAKREVRMSIEERFRWTIRLDNRYLVIALVIALRTLDGVSGEGFSPDQVREDCEVYWPAGFDRGVLSSPEYRRYLSEMVGLGVLYSSGEGVRAEYGLSNQSILGLLGTREDLEADLEDCESLEVDVEANQTMNRRVLSRTGDSRELRAPLSDGELATLVGPAIGDHSKQIVIGTVALGIDRVAQAVARAAEDVGVTVVTVSSAAEVTRELGAKGIRHVVLNLVDEAIDVAAIQAAISAVPTRPGTQLTAVLHARHFDALELQPGEWHTVALRRWSESGLKCWQDTPFVGPADRRELRTATSGWPELVEATVARVNDGQQKKAALEEVDSWIAQRSHAETFVESVGIDRHVAARWAAIGMSGPWSLSEIGEILGASDAAPIVEGLVRLDVVDESNEGWSLDPLVIAAMSVLAAP